MPRWPVAVVVLLFLGSLAALAASSAVALWTPGEELATRQRLRESVSALADAAVELLPRVPAGNAEAVLSESSNRRFAAVAEHVLSGHQGVEGGFYLPRSDQFAGFVPPGGSTVVGTKGPEKKGKNKKTVQGGRRDPPPLETRLIRAQAREAAERGTDEPPQVEIRDVGPSHVAVTAAAVGEQRPARLVVWVMVRMSGPEQQRAQLIRLRLATVLSLGGVLLALGLATGLVRSLRHEQRHRERLRDELRQSEHLASLGRLLAGVAHEVRNPLAAVRSTVQLWERLPDQARTPASLQAVIGAVDRLNELVGRLLLFARSGHESRQPIDLNAVAAETLELLRAQAGTQGVVLEADLAAGLPHVAGSGEALRQAALNLAGNALQAMPSGGRLTFRTRALPRRRVELSVSDTGPGVPAEARDRLFDPFFTTRPDGTGLGLALCREIARQHGGDVSLDPENGQGATFRIVLPAARIDAERGT